MYILPILIIALATAGIFLLKKVSSNWTLRFHKDGQINILIKFQLLQFVLSLVVLAAVYLLNPANFRTFFRAGDLSAPASGIHWLAVPAGMPWWEVAATLGLWITLGTAIFMFFQVRKANPSFKALLAFLPGVVLFSAMNAFAEESIFRLGIVSPLYGQLPVAVIALISGVLFGIPHYFGMPKGIIGALMAGFLGWLLAMSMVESGGMFLAWGVHFIQDVVIIASMVLISHPGVKKTSLSPQTQPSTPSSD